MKTHVDLCSGIGGFALGFEWAQLSRPVLFCDTDDWCRRILRKHWSHVPIAEDVKDLANDPERLVPDCSILTAGYPCQPFSVAGKQRGAEDDRHIWPEIRTIVEAKRPDWCVFENVYGHIKLGLDEVLSDLEDIGYATRPFVVPACAVNAPHKRNRVWIIAHADSEGESGRTIDAVKGQGELVGNAEHDGSSSTAIRGEHKEDARGTSKRKKASKQSARTGERGDTSNVADTDSNDGRHGSGSKSQERQARVEHGRGGKRQPVERTSQSMADTDSEGSQGQWGQHRLPEDKRERETSWTRWWEFEPPVGRVANGVPRRVDRIRGLGNAIVPQIAQQIGTAIKENYDGKI
jgi:DNA (cytosine-5)-methyltransferase 1